MNQPPPPTPIDTSARTRHWVVLALVLLVCLIFALTRDVRVTFTFELNRKSPVGTSDGQALPQIDLPPIPPFPSIEKIPPPSIGQSEDCQVIHCCLGDTAGVVIAPPAILRPSPANQGPSWKR